MTGMTGRENIAKLIHWKRIMWLVGIMNPCMMLPQLYQLWTTGVSWGISLTTLWILVFLQGAFSAHGFFIRDRPVLWSNGVACFMRTLTCLSVLYFRS